MAAAARKNGKPTGKAKPPVEHQFKVGNPGRPKGSRNKLGEAFIEALHDDFVKHGVATIAKVRETDPTAYVKTCASLLPKELKVTRTDEMTDDELLATIRQLDSIIRPFLGVEDEGGARAGAETTH